tara:strand:+ start:358 stop:633 length:276 start_codon:yes stop_codon:yes gene_type:complete
MRCGSITHHYQASNKSDLTLGEFKKEYVEVLSNMIRMDAIPLSEQYRINIKDAIELIDKTLESVEKSNVVLSGKHLKEIRKAISKKPYQKL